MAIDTSVGPISTEINNTIGIRTIDQKSDQDMSKEYPQPKVQRKTSDYRLDKIGRKIKAHTLKFNKGEDDGQKGVTEQMKKNYKDFVFEHTLELTEEELNVLEHELNEVLGKDAKAGDWIHDFIRSANPQFKGKSVDKRKQMALAAYYAAQRNEEVELDEVSFSGSHQGKTTLKHIKDPGVELRMAAHDIKPGVKGYRDRIALLKAAQAQGKLKEENMNEELHPEADKVLKHIKPEHHAKYAPDLAKGTYKGDYADRTAVLKAAERAGHLKESSVFDWKNKPRATSDKTQTKTYHDVKKISTGTVYTKQFDKDGTSKGTGGDAAAKAENAPKRGRGRPKKDKFAESVEMLMSLSEEQFDSMMEEGFDAFFEAYEQLDELSKATLGSYAKKAAVDAKFKGFDAGHQEGGAQARSKTMYGGSGAGSETDEKAHSRLRGVKKAIDRLTK